MADGRMVPASLPLDPIEREIRVVRVMREPSILMHRSGRSGLSTGKTHILSV